MSLPYLFSAGHIFLCLMDFDSETFQFCYLLTSSCKIRKPMQGLIRVSVSKSGISAGGFRSHALT